jgi:release factor glutamine methyltransferase
MTPERSTAANETRPWTTRDLLQWMSERFASREMDSPRLVAELLLSHVLACERMRLYMEADRPASPEELRQLRELVIRADRQEPVQYLVGRTAFFGREFLVDRSTQIPQPCTEELLSLVIDWWRARKSESDAGPGRPRIADIGTGSGCMAISLALQFPEARIVATDLSSDALELAARNAARHAVSERVELREGSLFEPFRGHEEAAFDVIASNPPYIPDHEWEGGDVEPGVKKYVPSGALRGGRDGLDVIRPLVADSAEYLRPGGLLVIEIADCQRDGVLELVERTPRLVNTATRRDHDGFWRFLIAERAG